ncbi:MAG: methyltransferase domain-containing protein [Terracidiphilus sp.]|jgi:2-polyprenyl-3-methyl-5-hydroxy-6-metoxy-1,4-benzoquinol methylase
MPLDGIDFSKRAQLTERMDAPCTRDEMRACLRDIGKLNRWTLANLATMNWLNAVRSTLPLLRQPLSILDVGCGDGDALRRIEQWAMKQGIAVELVGIDLNLDAAALATEARPYWSRIRYFHGNVFAYRPQKPIHVVISSLLTHHLSDLDVVRFLQWMEKNAEIGWFINDLSRSEFAYRFIKIFSKLAMLHPFVQKDAPISIARAFVREEWQTYCRAAGLQDGAAQILSVRPARLCVARRKPL